MRERRPSRTRASAVLLGVLAVGACTSGAAPGPVSSTGGPHSSHAAEPGPGPDAYADQLVEATNDVRDEAGLPALGRSACAADEALARAAALVGTRLEHAPLDGVLAACAPPEGTAAENLSRAAAEPAAVVDAWMGSPGHRANLLDPTLTAVGIGCVDDPSGGEGAFVCAQVFLG